MIKILHIIGGSANAGGVGAVVYNYMKHIDQNEYHFDFALLGCEPGMIGKEMIKLGAKCHRLPLKSRDLQGYKKQLYRILIEEEYDAIHVHESSTSYIALRVAEMAGVSCRIAHAHIAWQPKSFRAWLAALSGRFFNYRYATRIIGCGQRAGEFVFGKRHMKSPKALVLPNAIEPERFLYREDIRNETRCELGIHDKYAIGMIGRFSTQKNQRFILPVIRLLHQHMDDFVFLMAGTGELEDEIKEYCHENAMDEYVRFLGVRKDVDRIYQALDVCVMPSLYEGFPVVGIEAIAAGLPLILSDRITTELQFGKHVNYLPLEEDLWIKTLRNKPLNPHREDGSDEVRKNGYDIIDAVTILQNVYKQQ